MRLVAKAWNGRDAVEEFRRHWLHVSLMDIRLPDMSGTDAMSAIRHELPDARIIMLTTVEDDAEIRRALESGARGYLLKSLPPREIVDGIRRAHSGRPLLGEDGPCP